MKRYDDMTREELLAVIDTLVRERESARLLRHSDAVYEQRISMLTAELLELNERHRREVEHKKTTEHELVLSNHEWENTFNAITDPVMLLDADHEIRQANRAMAEYFGVPQAELKGHHCYEFMHGSDKPVPSCPQNLLLHDRQPHSVDIYDEHTGRCLQESVSPIFDNDENLVGSIHYAKDVTENRKLIAALQESEARYHSLFDFSSDAIFLSNADDRIITANPAACRMFGWSEEEMIALGRTGLVDTADPRLKPALEERARTGLFFGELSFIRKDGTKFPAEISSVIFHDYTGHELACIIIRDISERKRYEHQLQHLNATLEERVLERTAELRGSENRLHLALDAARAGTWEWDLTADRNIWSDEIWHLYGLDPNRFEPSYATWRQTVHPDDLKRTERAVRTAVEAESELSVEYRVVDEDGSSRWLFSRGTPMRDDDGKVIRYVGIVVDISERVEFERKLKETALFLSESQRIAQLGGWKANPETGYVMWTEEIYHLLEHPRDAPLNLENGIQYYAPDQIPLVRAALKDAWANNKPFNMECDMISATGRHFPAELRCIGRIRLPGGTECLAGTFQDISSMKVAEDALRKSEEMYRNLFSNMVNGFAYCRLIIEEGNPVDYVYLIVNDGFEQLTGLKSVIGRKMTEVIPGIYESNPELFETYGRVVGSGQPEHFEVHIPQLEKWFNASAYRPATDHFVVTFSDITKRKQAEEVQRKLHAMTVELAMAGDRERARIAGELHDQVGPNLLTCMMKLNVLRNDLSPVDSAGVMDQIEELLDGTVHEIRSLTFQLRPPILATAGLAAALKWLAKEYGERYGLVVSLAARDEDVSLQYEVKSVIFQVLRELLLNVVKHAQTSTVSISLRHGPERLVVTVADNGIGFDLKRIDPHIGEHVGFGLFNIRQKIEYLGGTVSIDSTPGCGALIMLTVPIDQSSGKEEDAP